MTPDLMEDRSSAMAAHQAKAATPRFVSEEAYFGQGVALYVPQVGIINPGEMSPASSIEIAIWAAVGGRGSLVGPIVGAFFVNGAKSWFTQVFPEFWLYFLGALFIAVTLFLPHGIIGLLRDPGGFMRLVQRMRGGAGS